MNIQHKRRVRSGTGALLVAVSLVLAPTIGVSADRSVRFQAQGVPDSIAQLKLAVPESAVGEITRLDPSLRAAQGRQQVIVRLTKSAVGPQLVHKGEIMAQQDAFISRCHSIDPSARLLARTQLALNAVFLDVDASALAELAADPAVARIARVKDYEMDLSETVPYIGASAVQAAGFDGSGVRVAILDSGVDYYHANLGGAGDPADYSGDDPTIIEAGTFPTAKVVGGFDFVGGLWPAGALAPDPDPLDDGPAAGHGTHVADITAGAGGVAPGAHLYAVKVCSSVSSACSGIALIQGMDFAVDPNGDGDPSDHVHIINMSLGANYGQPFDDDLSLAVENASALGVLTVASAGNSADKPYVTGSPAATPTALSVAQTQVPSAGLQFITVDGVDYAAVFQPWSVPLAGVIAAPVQYGDGVGGNLNGCAPFAAGSLAGMIVLVDRGACNFTLKISNISQADGLLGIIGLVAPGGPFSGGDGGDRPIDIPGYMISQADSNAIKSSIAGGGGTGRADPANQLPLLMQMVGSSSRGPSGNFNAIKPEIGAPGASVSATAGTGTGTNAFGGTSGAAPMVSGSAALILDAYPGLSPVEVKARLVNNGETDIDTDPFLGLAPITRIGGGEVRVDRAVDAIVGAWDADTGGAALSFGFLDVRKEKAKLKKEVLVRNYSGEEVTYHIMPTFRFAEDEANGAVSVRVSPRKVKLAPGADRIVNVKMTINGTALRGNFMNAGSRGADPSALTINEYDGYLNFTSPDGPDFHMPWQVLPRQAAHIKRGGKKFKVGGDTLFLDNKGVGTAQNDGYSLLGISPNQPEGPRGGQSPTPDLRAVGVQTFLVPAGFCSGVPSFLWVFAVNTWERQDHLVPVVHNVYLDTDQDGIFDFVVFNFDLSFSGAVSDGRQLTWAFDLSTESASAFFFTEHAMNTGNTVLVICGEQVGLTGTDVLATNVDAYVEAEDFYFGGPGDLIASPADPLTITPFGERFFALPSDIPGNSGAALPILDFGPFPGNTGELGILLITNGDRGTGARGGATQESEALAIGVKGADLSALKDGDD